MSTAARDNIKKTITEKFNSQKRSYDQTRGSYIQGINALTGRSDGEKFITEFETPPINAGGDNSSAPAAGADGAAYGFPGYHSDGTQWMPK